MNWNLAQRNFHLQFLQLSMDNRLYVVIVLVQTQQSSSASLHVIEL